MNIKDICKLRNIRKVNISTPLIVPSFSSKGFPDIKEIYNRLKEHIVDSSLISCYDLKHGFINEEDIYNSDLLFVDSGGFEKRTDKELSDIYGEVYIAKEWSATFHLEIVNQIKEYCKIVLINYDDEQCTISEQINNAISFFNNYPNYASDFLYKPSSEQDEIDIDNYIKNLNSMESFCILGFTEKELGDSLLKRCTNIIRIRSELNDKDYNTPIHIFGCIDPLHIITYYLCGADIFDGLSWLRFSFYSGVAVYRNSYSIINNNWSFVDNRLRALCFVKNLEVLTNLMSQMRYFTRSYNINVFQVKTNVQRRLLELVSQAGLDGILC